MSYLFRYSNSKFGTIYFYDYIVLQCLFTHIDMFIIHSYRFKKYKITKDTIIKNY